MFRIVLFLFVISNLIVATEISLGVVPQQSPLELSKKWLKITEYLEERTGVKIVFKTEKSIPLFEEKLYAGEYDIVYMNPYHYIVANKMQDYKAFIRSKDNIVGIILGRVDTAFDINDLKNKTFLFPAPNAFAATLLTKFELKKKYGFDIDNETKVLYVNSHDSVYKGVARNIGDFGGGIVRTYDNFKDDEKKEIKIVYETDAYPSHPIAYHPNKIDKVIVEKLTKAFLEMPEDLKGILSIKDFIKTEAKEYDVIKELGVK